MTFDDEKRRYLEKLGKPDKSKKGGVDEAVKPLLDAINAQRDYYTTSSCAGRITLFVEPASAKKHEGEWLLATHDEAEAREVRAALAEAPQETTWFRMEGAILHVCCRDVDAANRFLAACKEAGWKHSGITGATKRVIVEATAGERMDVPVAKEGALLMPVKFLDYLVREANGKLARTREKLERLEAAL